MSSRLAWRRSVALDLLLVAVVAAASVAQSLRFPGDGRIDQAWASVAVGLVAAAALGWRRQRPLTVAAVVVGAGAVEPNALALWIALYTAAAYVGPARRLWVVVAAAAAVGSVGPVYVGTTGSPIGWVVSSLFGVGVPVLFGLWVGTRRRLLASLRDRAVRLEREQHLLAERARIEERTRIAREMHDVVAHRVSLIVLQAGALELAAANDPAQAAQTAGVIRATGRQALEELRSMIGVLRTDRDGADHSPPLAPQPTLADVPALVEEWRTAGLEVRLTVSGDEQDEHDAQPVDPVAARTAYRIVQEALTNVHKHAGPVAVRVALERRAEAMTVDVTNAAAGGAAPRTELPAGGNGLVGLRERVGLIGGTIEAGPQRYGGWQVRAVLPLRPPGGSA